MTVLQAEDLFSEIKLQFVNSLEEQTWMDETTRKGARDKVNTKRLESNTHTI